jgi:hypothetical protein
MIRRFGLVIVVIACCALCHRGVLAQAPAAERALAAADYAQAAELAEAALTAGGLKPAQWTLLQSVLGTAYAKLGRAEPARRAFISALALDPKLKLSGDQPVEVRSPFMEARGFWSQHAERLSVSAVLSDDRLALVVSLVDPAALAARVIVRVRAAGQGAFVESSLLPASTMLVSLETLGAAAGIEYSLALIDENANLLWQLGSEAVPLSAGKPSGLPSAAAVAASALPGAEFERRSVPPASPVSYYVGAAISLVVAGGAALVAGLSHRARERLAERWNDARCDGPGTTRGMLCGRERDQLERHQRLAIGFYSLAGAGLVAGIVSLALAPARARSAPDARAFRCRPGPGLAGLECGAKF